MDQHPIRSEAWWKHIEQLHAQLTRILIGRDSEGAALSIDRHVAAGLFACRECLGNRLDETNDHDSSRHARSIIKLNADLTWAFQKINQFESPSENARKLLGELTLEWLSDLKSGLTMHDPQQWTEHVRAVCSRYLEKLESHVSTPKGSRPKITSEEYSVNLQLQVLHLTLDEMHEPILDIGCGQAAALVQWLLRHQKNALGIDACASAAQGCLSVDWFEFPFVPEHFGTITAHLSFTLHFLKHHLDIHGQAENYARQYMNMLRSLRVGGRMVYTPGLPFIEKLLPPHSFRVERFMLADFPRDTVAAQIYTRHLGEDPLYACHVERVQH